MSEPNHTPPPVGAPPGATADELAVAVDAARQSAQAAQAAAEASLQTARAAQQIAESMRAMLASLPRGGGPIIARALQPTLAPRAVLPPIPHDVQIVIIAAVAAALRGRQFRVQKIHLADRPSLGWGRSGRAGIHESHSRARWK